jgi:hypothetical protein
LRDRPTVTELANLLQKFKVQNAKLEMQNAKCNVQNTSNPNQFVPICSNLFEVLFEFLILHFAFLLISTQKANSNPSKT